MGHQILIPLDGSPLAETVIPHAIQYAKAHASDLHLVRVVVPSVVTPSIAWPMPTPVNVERWLEAEHDEAKEYLATVANRLQPTSIGVHTTVLEGDPATCIMDFAREESAIRIVAMATHGRNGFNRWVFGSVTEKVLQATSFPLLVVREDVSHVDQNAPPFNPEVCYKTIVVPLDGSAFAEQALVEAQILATCYKATLILVSAVPYLDDVGLGEGGIVPMWTISEKQTVQQSIAHYLDAAAKRLTDAGIQVQIRQVEGSPAEIIAATAQDEHGDLIVMSTHGRSGLSRLWLGSVATKVVRNTTIPILLVQAQETEV